ncbi:hypothetical protein [Deinococcus ruber]|uniref:RNA polymerase sigma-70 region 2 domain-containing protein n=1 Tax=Deinococcus ruber TaxID=1848197 RepID=A0A918CHU3_9DEIO|nr:hypothetical protein [Deinococcus ruber]GGR23098.1 hypothetical protein GCM10008957_38790 [Deinococcus ruber]
MTQRVDARTDEGLLQGMAQQDAAALMELYRRYGGQSLALARQYGFPEPEQVVEDGFLLLFRSVEGFSRCSLPAAVWIVGMLHRHCYTWSPLRTRPRQSALFLNRFDKSGSDPE